MEKWFLSGKKLIKKRKGCQELAAFFVIPNSVRNLPECCTTAQQIPYSLSWQKRVNDRLYYLLPLQIKNK
jgi:hypothetical protein